MILEKLDFLKTADVAKILNVSTQTVWTLIQNGEIEAVKVGKLYRIERAALEKFIKMGGK